MSSNGSVTVSLGYTMNIGNFESLRFDYGVTAPVESGETYDDAITRVEAIVEERLMKRLKEEESSNER